MRFAALVYRLLLRTYPGAFRRDHEASMRSTFEAIARRDGVMRTLAREMIDVPRSAIRLRSERRIRSGKGAEIELWFKDLRQATRALFRVPGFTIAAIVSLALGIGVNAGVFGLVDAALVKPMPLDAPESVVAIYATRGADRFPSNFSYPNYVDLAEATNVFSDVVGFQGAPLSLNVGGADPELVWCEIVTDNYFSGLRVPFARGRGFARGDGRAAVLSYEFWNRRFGASESALGSQLRLNGNDFTVVGIASEGFTGAKFLGFTPQLWVPIRAHEVVWPGSEGRLERRTGGWLNLRARLTEGASSGEAAAALEAIASRLEAEHPDINRELRLHLIPAARKTEPVIEIEVGSAIPIAARVVFAVGGIVLLLACANVASLQLARSASRRRELAVRISMGATRSRLVRQLLLESLLLAVAGGSLGLALGKSLIDAAMRLNPVLDFSVDLGAKVDARVVMFTALVSLLAGFVAGLLPALRAARRDASESFRDSDSARRRMSRRWIVIPQLALSLVALLSAGLLVRSFQNVRAASPGFAKQGLLLASVNLDLHGYGPVRGRRFHRLLLQRLRSLPTVEAASLAFPLPLDASSRGGRLFPDTAPGSTKDDDGLLVFSSVVGEGYFDTMSTEIVAGRAFDERDHEDARPVAIVNETLANLFWPSESPVGRGLRTSREKPPLEVIGVARDGKYMTLGEQPRPYFFLPLRQEYSSPITILVRTRATPRSFEEGLRREVRALDPTLPVYGVKTMEEFLGRSTAGPRGLALAISLFALLALALAAVGIYGLMSFSVSQKRRYIGIRMALGATRRDVFKLFLKEAASVVFLGLAIGLPAAWASTRVLSSLLFGVSPGNPPVLLSVVLLLVAVALAGSLFPSRRATQLDPISTLRHE
ncbi:MAG TPA: ABC transporter permease [Vicinamibacteria bacterium]|nr:ABC transporter permease [Vicinamibacteria bacterium]